MKKLFLIFLLICSFTCVFGEEKELTLFDGLNFGTEMQNTIDFLKERNWRIYKKGSDGYTFFLRGGKIEDKTISGKSDLVIFFRRGKLREFELRLYKPEENRCNDFINGVISKYALSQPDISRNEYFDSNKNIFKYYASGSYWFFCLEKAEEIIVPNVPKDPKIEFLGGEFLPGYNLSVNILENGQASYGYLYPDIFEQSGIPKCVCSRIAPSSDGYVELVITIPSILKSNEFSLYVKTGDEIIFNIKAPINNGLRTFQSKLLIKIVSARPNSIKYEVVKKL